VTWYDLDLPEVMAVCCKLLDETPRNRFLGCSALDSSWMDAIRDDNQHYLFLAEGVLPYFKEAKVRHLILALGDRFPGPEVVFDAMSPFLVHTHSLELAFSRINARLQWGLKRDQDVEAWGAGIRLLSRWSFFEQHEPRLDLFRLLRFFPGMDRSVQILRYRLGDRVEGATIE
jgi:O-methyltransferase involved in polyketide biosynthesis